MDSADEILSTEASLAIGDSYFIDEDYESAVNAYAVALSTYHGNEGGERGSVTQFRVLSHKAAALLRLDRYDEAVHDGKLALAGFVPGLREGETEACYHRVGVALFRLEQYDEALAMLEQASQLASLNHKRDTKTKHDEYIQRCKDAKLHQDVHMVEPEDSDMVIVEEIEQKAPAQSFSSPTVATITTSKIQKPSMPKYQYYQNDKVMTIAILEPNMRNEDLQVTFGTKRLTVIVKKQGFDFTVICGKLFDKVDTQNANKRLNDDDDDDDDDDDTRKKKKPTTGIAPDEVPIVQPGKKTVPRPYSSHRDWDAIERNLKEQEKQEKPQGEEAMNALFQQIYAKADPDTQRAMIKSYQTSGGTVLSTNWGEVKEKDYEKEREAPKGMEWKTWEGEKLDKKKP
ncbi:SGS domain [Fragilaria crotonensis]|nr:SGS domain [Fragilaria crotonensis]